MGTHIASQMPACRMLWPGSKSAVGPRVRRANPLPCFQDVVDDASRNGHPRRLVGPASKADHLGHALTGLGIGNQHAAAVGPDHADRQVEDPLEQLIDRQRRTDGLLRNPIDRLQIREGLSRGGHAGHGRPIERRRLPRPDPIRRRCSSGPPNSAGQRDRSGRPPPPDPIPLTVC